MPSVVASPQLIRGLRKTMVGKVSKDTAPEPGQRRREHTSPSTTHLRIRWKRLCPGLVEVAEEEGREYMLEHLSLWP